MTESRRQMMYLSTFPVAKPAEKKLPKLSEVEQRYSRMSFSQLLEELACAIECNRQAATRIQVLTDLYEGNLRVAAKRLEIITELQSRLALQNSGVPIEDPSFVQLLEKPINQPTNI